MTRHLLIILVLFFSLNCSSYAATVNQLSLNETTLQIYGSDMGEPCKPCEVIASFDGLIYSLIIHHWSGNRIQATLTDVGLNLNPYIQVVTPTWKSKPMAIQITPDIVPDHQVSSFNDVTADSHVTIFTRRYDSTLGGKGEEVFDVSQPLPSCGKKATIYHSAQLLLSHKTRFGEARITDQPGTGCKHCNVRVKYYWEPTGRLAYQLLVYHRVVDGICASQIR